jgi:hypothetical protein
MFTVEASSAQGIASGAGILLDTIDALQSVKDRLACALDVVAVSDPTSYPSAFSRRRSGL